MSEMAGRDSESIGHAVDCFGRPVKSLRLSVTQRCDLKCSHCHREGQKPSQVEMTPEEIERLARISTSVGISRIKLTGGEPLMRPDIVEIVRRVSRVVSEVSLTTNGLKLAGLVDQLKVAGLARVNVSLHSRDREVYEHLCGNHSVGSVIDGISKAVSAGLNPVKVNMVVFRGVNDDSIDDMIDFCAEANATLQLIEYETSREGSRSEDFQRYYFPLADIESRMAVQAMRVDFNELHRRKRYTIPYDGRQVCIEIVRPMHNTEFCAHCTRLRLSSDGKLKPCLLDRAGEIDALSPLRNGASDEAIAALFADAISRRRPYWM